MTDGYLFRNASAGKYAGPDPEIVRVLMAEIRRLDENAIRDDRTIDRIGEELGNLRNGVDRIAREIGVDIDDMDDAEVIAAIRGAIPALATA